MKVLFINNSGGGFADYVDVESGTTVTKFFERQLPGAQCNVNKQARFRKSAASVRFPECNAEKPPRTERGGGRQPLRGAGGEAGNRIGDATFSPDGKRLFALRWAGTKSNFKGDCDRSRPRREGH